MHVPFEKGVFFVNLEGIDGRTGQETADKCLEIVLGSLVASPSAASSAAGTTTGAAFGGAGGLRPPGVVVFAADEAAD